MAKNGKGGGKSGSGMLSPLYTAPGQNLGPVKPAGKVSFSPPDPMGFTHGKFKGGPGSENRTQSHDKE